MLGFAADNFPCRHTPSSVKHCGTALRNGTATYGRAGKATGTPSAARVAARSANGSNGNAAEVSLKICIYLYIYEKKKKKKKKRNRTHTHTTLYRGRGSVDSRLQWDVPSVSSRVISIPPCELTERALKFGSHFLQAAPGGSKERRRVKICWKS